MGLIYQLQIAKKDHEFRTANVNILEIVTSFYKSISCDSSSVEGRDASLTSSLKSWTVGLSTWVVCATRQVEEGNDLVGPYASLCTFLNPFSPVESGIPFQVTSLHVFHFQFLNHGSSKGHLTFVKPPFNVLLILIHFRRFWRRWTVSATRARWGWWQSFPSRPCLRHLPHHGPGRFLRSTNSTLWEESELFQSPWCCNRIGSSPPFLRVTRITIGFLQWIIF